uniref:Uncharacterized protein n=1 Tax=Arundo donax TaxID=35708 RepID=A0A0A8ZDF1_ARUDO
MHLQIKHDSSARRLHTTQNNNIFFVIGGRIRLSGHIHSSIFFFCCIYLLTFQYTQIEIVKVCVEFQCLNQYCIKSVF